MAFWPPAVILVAALAASVVGFDRFDAIVSELNEWILVHLGGVIGGAPGLLIILGCGAALIRLALTDPVRLQ